MTVLETERWSGYEAAWPGHHRQPFDGVEQYPRVITRADADTPRGRRRTASPSRCGATSARIA